MADTSRPPKHRKASSYPEPFVIPPVCEHRQTLIILHGRGSSASKFAPELLATEIPEFGSLADAFSNARFVFPTASKRRAAVYNRSIINQWFDNGSLDTPTEREELQIEGLCETTAYLHGLLKKEIALVGAENIVLWGLSQGCAAVLISLLTWDGEPLAAAVGMCGWLPFQKHLEEIVRDVDISTDNKYPFSRPADEHSSGVETSTSPIQSQESTPPNGAESPPMRALTYLSEELQTPAPRPQQQPMSFQRTPLFPGHGAEDEKVPVALGREAARCLDGALAMDIVRWRQYEGLGHWYSKEMVSDIVSFLRDRTAIDR